MKNIVAPALLALVVAQPAFSGEGVRAPVLPRIVNPARITPRRLPEGKPSLPVTVKGSLEGTVRTTDKELLLVVTVTPSSGKVCASIRVSVRTIGDVVVKSAPAQQACKSGVPVSIKGTLLVPKAGVGSYVVDVVLESDGKRRGMSREFRVFARGAEMSNDAPGHLLTGSDGQEIIVMEPSAPK